MPCTKYCTEDVIIWGGKLTSRSSTGHFSNLPVLTLSEHYFISSKTSHTSCTFSFRIHLGVGRGLVGCYSEGKKNTGLFDRTLEDLKEKKTSALVLPTFDLQWF